MSTEDPAFVRFSDLQNRRSGAIECPRCGCGHFNTLRTTPNSAGVIIRRKQCRHCGHRVTTRETVIKSA